MIACYPSCCQIERSSGGYLLHDALERFTQLSSEDVILLVIDLYPDAVRMEDRDGNLPLHIECRHQCRHEVTRKLVTIYPESLRIKDKDGSVPLHCAFDNECSISDLIFYLIDLYPEAVLTSDVNADLPLHLECITQCRLEVIMKLVTIYPTAIRIFGNRKRYPLHFAVTNEHCSPDAIFYLIKLYPDALIEPSCQYIRNQLPFHQILKNGRFPSEMIQQLIDLYPHLSKYRP